MRIVCLGAGLAVVRAVDELLRIDPACSIEVIGAESMAPYDRPPLSKAVLRGEIEAPPLWPGGAPANVHLRLGVGATGVDVSSRQVRLGDGSTVSYDALIIGTGAEPRRLPGLDGPDVHYLRTGLDARHLRDAVRAAGRLTILGGGFIGCEVAASLRTLEVPVTLIERAPALMSPVLGTVVGVELTRLHVEHGVDVRCGASVVGRNESGLALDDGAVLPAGPVLVSVGAVPSSAWLEGSGLLLERGAVVCDGRGRASAPGVWAVGDVSAWTDASGLPHRHEHWTSAADQGAAVARDILGEEPAPVSVPYFWSDQYDVKVQMLGLPSATDLVEPVEVDGKRLFLYLREGRLAAAVGLGAARPLMRLRAAVSAQAVRAAVPV